jgi:tetratricopeptide (TPR) repeat protein
MSEQTGNTQPMQPIKEDDTQPIKPVKPGKKGPRWGSILISILGVIMLLFLGGLGGYGSGIKIRTDAASQAISSQLTEQFQYALVDEQFGRYEAAKQRLEFIIQNDPTFPGVQNELAKVLVQMTIPTITPTPVPTSTPDLRGEQSLFATAQQLIAAGDWANALTELDQLRKEDPNYNTSQVYGMYYFALRNYGVYLIQQQGNLEGGIYELTLAERFGPLDRDGNGLREGARAYIQAASFYGIDWHLSVNYWAQVASGWPSLWDGTMTAAQRYQISLMRYGDDLVKQGQFCDAYQQYQTAQSIGNLDEAAAKGANQAFQQCYPATEVPTETPTGVAVPTDTPAATPTDTPAAAPTETPSS